MLKNYWSRLYSTIVSRGDLEIDELTIDDRSTQRGSIKGERNLFSIHIPVRFRKLDEFKTR